MGKAKKKAITKAKKKLARATETATPVFALIPNDVRAALDAWCGKTRASRVMVITEALRVYLKMPGV